MAVAMAHARRSFLCLFAQEHPDFRLQELLSIASVTGNEISFDPKTYSNKNPVLVVQLQSESSANQIASRAMLIKSIFELWGWGRNYSELEASIKKDFPSELMERYKATDYTFKLIAGGFSRKCNVARQKWIFERLSFLPFGGRVDLSNPTHEFHIIEDYGDNPNTSPSEPLRVFFGRLISHGQRHLIRYYSIKNRLFIGNTSMDAQLSLIMANQAKVRPGSLVFDPFAGTGGILIACAHYGGYVMGADIDSTLVHGRGCSSRADSKQKYRGRGESVEANLRQYGLEHRYVDMLVADAASSIWRQKEIFDAIVTDPPYGIREGGRKIGSRKEVVIPVPPELREGHIPSTRSYKLSELFTDLVKFAVRYLVVGGRLVYWVPVILHEFTADALPTHPCLELVSTSVQPLQRQVGRLLVTMEKRLAWSEQIHGTELEQQIQSLKMHDSFREKYFSVDNT